MYKLQPRDQVILDLLGEHQTLTTPQIAAILFQSRKTASNRLYQLRAQGWLEVFSRAVGRQQLPQHWVLGPLGERWVAAGQDRPPLAPGALVRRMDGIAANLFILHDDGQRQVFVELLRAARTSDQPPSPYSVQDRTPVSMRLARWWSPTHTSSFFGQRVRPDGHGVWEENHDASGQTVQVSFFLEYDRGTEVLEELVGKLTAYEQLQRMGDRHAVLFWLESTRRERNLQARLAASGVPTGLTVATTAAQVASADPYGPAGQVWWVASPGAEARRRLADLPPLTSSVQQALGPPTMAEDPLRSLNG